MVFSKQWSASVHVNPGEVSGDCVLLQQYALASLKRSTLLVAGAVVVSPVLCMIVARLPLPSQRKLREFLDEESNRVEPPVRVLGKDTDHKKGGVSSQGQDGMGVAVSVYNTVNGMLRRAVQGVSHFSVMVLPRHSQGVALARRTVTYVLSSAAGRAVSNVVNDCLVSALMLVICKALDASMHAASSHPSLSGFAQPLQNVGGDPPVKGSYGLQDFALSAAGFPLRCFGTTACAVAKPFLMITMSRCNWHWRDNATADTMWSRLTPTGFMLVSFFDVLYPILKKGCSEGRKSLTRYVKKRYLSDQREGRPLSNGSITVARKSLHQVFMQGATVLVSYHSLGTPAVAYLAAKYPREWTRRMVWFRHSAGPSYESVSVCILFWALIGIRPQGFSEVVSTV